MTARDAHAILIIASCGALVFALSQLYEVVWLMIHWMFWSIMP